MSKELESLQRIGNYQIVSDYEKDEVKTLKELLPSSYKTIETALKALEIIKEKFNIGLLNETCNNNLKVYQLCSSTARIYITQEEYDLLKEVLL